MSDQPIPEQNPPGLEPGLGVQASYAATRDRVEQYFDKSATKVWARLTSDEDVSRIRQTVRAGRDAMRDEILGRLPEDLKGRRILDAGCGVGQLSAELAKRGADVLAVDISPSLIEIARERHADSNISYVAGDMLDPSWGVFDHIVAMDSLIYYKTPDLGSALSTLKLRTSRSIVFTVAPRTPFLMAFWGLGQVFPRSDRSPTMVPQSPKQLEKHLTGGLVRGRRISNGFYISQCLEVRR
ncbi:MAG: magnesium protoporphyrin IX methyltransferase [Rhodobacteraceae bacterium]|nr:magnesium protoporphyrin IX methyltransferase [Paracoccaceae bacterium]